MVEAIEFSLRKVSVESAMHDFNIKTESDHIYQSHLEKERMAFRSIAKLSCT